jgi:CheY-like chemotaxis protein
MFAARVALLSRRRVALNFAPRVLIVDESSESREVLSALLTRRGAKTFEAHGPRQAIQLADLHQVDLIVFDADSDHSDTGSGIDDVNAVANRNGTPIVILGTVRQLPKRFASGQIVSKPYHYGPLIDKIEDLLAAA